MFKGLASTQIVDKGFQCPGLRLRILKCNNLHAYVHEGTFSSSSADWPQGAYGHSLEMHTSTYWYTGTFTMAKTNFLERNLASLESPQLQN